MASDKWQRAQQVFLEVADRPPKEQASLLEEACGDDAELRAEVESLLEHDSQVTDDFLRPPEPPPSVRQPDSPAGSDPLIGKRVGQYTVKSVIATGGMGTVYEAVQDQPRRVVALKVMKRNVASRSALRRFQFESQVLGRLRHPNIAQVYEAGMHDDGQARVPYFAMEYIPGARTIIQHADEKKLVTHDRLSLFAKVCDAVYHGHQKEIIHRDLKPANVLVDSTGEPKVIDFGVARATDSDLAATTQQTVIGQLVGTMQYMSPEQCDADPHDLDTRSDVYSLGVVLYELLTGELPYEATSSTIYQTTRIIKEEMPRSLSSLNPKLRGDVETITLKALEKDRDRRYSSAAEFADDIRHVINNEPIVAQPPSWAYLVKKLVQRHTWQAAALTAAVLLIVAALIAVGALGGMVKAQQERERAKVFAYGARIGAAEAALHAFDSANAQAILRQTDEDLRGWEWQHLQNRVDQSISDLLLDITPDAPCGASDPAISTSGTLAAVVARRAKDVCIFDINSKALLSKVPGRIATFSGDGTLLATASHVTQPPDHRMLIQLWSVDALGDREPTAKWIAHQQEISALAFSPTQPVLASGSGDETIKLWDLTNLNRYRTPGEPREVDPNATLHGHEWIVMDLAFSPDGARLASASYDYTVRLWDVHELLTSGIGKASAVLRGHTDYVYSVAFSPDGERLASASIDKTVRLWNVDTVLRMAAEAEDKDKDKDAYGPGVEIDTLHGHTEGVMCVAFDPTGRRLVSGGGDRVIRVWDLQEDAAVTDLHRQREWPVPRRGEVNTLRGHDTAVRGVAVLQDGRVLSVSDEGDVKLWLQDDEDVPRLRGHTTSVAATAFMPGNRHLASGAGEQLIVWDASLCVPVARRFVQGVDIHDLSCWEIGDHTYLAAATGRQVNVRDTGRIVVWSADDPTHPEHECTFQAEDCEECFFHSLAVSGDGRRLAAGDQDGVVRVWDIGHLPDVSQIQPLQGHTERVNGLVFLDRHGDWLVSASGSLTGPPSGAATIRVWSVESGEEIDQPALAEHDYPTMALALRTEANSRRGLLASASRDGSIRLWSIDWTGRIPRIRFQDTLEGHTDMVTAVEFHATEPRLFSSAGKADRTIKIWDLNTGAEVATLRGHVGGVEDLAFDAASERLASASSGFHGSDNVVRLWEPQSPADLRRQRAVARRAYGEVRRLALSAIPSLEDLKEKIRDDVDLPEAVREMALRRFGDFLPPATRLSERAKIVLSAPKATSDDYRRALNWAQAAADQVPEHAPVLITLGMVQYRLGQYKETLDTLRKSNELNDGHDPVDWALLAMAYHHLGDMNEAATALEHTRRLGQDSRWAKDADAQKWIREAEELVTSRPE